MRSPTIWFYRKCFSLLKHDVYRFNNLVTIKTEYLALRWSSRFKFFCLQEASGICKLTPCKTQEKVLKGGKKCDVQFEQKCHFLNWDASFIITSFGKSDVPKLSSKMSWRNDWHQKLIFRVVFTDSVIFWPFWPFVWPIVRKNIWLSCALFLCIM